MEENRATEDALATRAELEAWALELLPDPFNCPFDRGASFRADIRALGWASSPLWCVFSLIAGGASVSHPRIAPYVEYIREMFTPGSSVEVADPTFSTRQIVFEQAVYGYGLLCLGERLLGFLDETQRERFARWLNASNSIELPWGSWYVSRLFVNCGLRERGLLEDESRIDADAAAIENMYAGAGWYEDGTPFKRDPYIASTFHLEAMLIEHYASENPVSRVVHRARCFARDYRCWFDSQGRSIPFGRGLTYRFAPAAFWAAAALLGDDVCPRALSKAILLRSLSWWKRELGPGAALGVGYGYTGAPVREDYSTAGAALWALRAFVVMALPEEDPFWAIEPDNSSVAGQSVQEEPGAIIQMGARHNCMFSAQQYCSSGLIGRSSKYGKLCYSTAFGWNASVDSAGIGGFAVDNALALSVAGTDQFASRGRVEASEVHPGYVYSVWSLGSIARVETWLVPVDELRHVRVHHVESSLPLESYEGGFPVFGWNAKFDMEEKTAASVKLYRDPGTPLGCADACGQVCSITDVSECSDGIARALGLAGLSGLWETFAEEWSERIATTVRQNSQTNIYSSEPNAVPALKTAGPQTSLRLACLVYGDPGQPLASVERTVD